MYNFEQSGIEYIYIMYYCIYAYALVPDCSPLLPDCAVSVPDCRFFVPDCYIYIPLHYA